MTTRIREQIERVTDLKTKGTLTITTAVIEIPPGVPEEPLASQVQRVADSVNAMIMQSVGQESVQRESDLQATFKA